jgi:hypothetical protein
MKKFLLALFLVAFVAAPVSGQSGYLQALARYMQAETVSYYQSAEDTDTALFIRYVGTDTGTNTVAVAAGGDLAFVDAGTAGADVSVICPSGGTGGTIDVSNAACDTLGELVDVINDETDGNWVATIHAGLRSDSSNDTLLLLSAADAAVVTGLVINWDSDVVNEVNFVLSDVSDLRDYVGNDRTGDLLSNPFAGLRANLQTFDFSINFGSAGTYTVYSVAVDNVAQSETATILIGPLTAADNTLTTVAPMSPFGVFSRKNEKLLVKFSDSGTVAGVTTVTAYGYEMEAR